MSGEGGRENSSRAAPEPAPPPPPEMAAQPPTGNLIDFGDDQEDVTDGGDPLPPPEQSRGNRQSSVIATKSASEKTQSQTEPPTSSTITPLPEGEEGLTRAFTEKMAILDAEVAKLTEEEEDGEEERKDKTFAAAVAVVSPIPPPSPFKGGDEEDEEEEESLEEVTISTSDDDPLSAALAMAEELGHTAQAAAAATSRGGGAGGDSCPVSTTTTTTTSLPLVDLNQEYHLKWIRWKGALKLPVVTQNANGPCPLLAIINVLLLRKNIEFPPMIEIITAAQLMEYLCDFLLNNVPTNLPENVKLDFEQNLQDAVTILPRLSTGLDVNVKFSGVAEFEYTRECIIFDLLRIPLYHGWLVDPAETEVMRVVGSLSYNQLVDRIITYKGGKEAAASSSSSVSPAVADGGDDPMVSSEMFLAEEFLHASASQLTHYGLAQLIARVKEDELCVLFRNNHFITLYKYKGKLYQLATDQGFLTESNVVWESLNNIEGDTYFVDGEFHPVPPKPALPLTASGDVAPFIANTQQQIDQDYLIALSLEAEQKQEMERNSAVATSATSPTTSRAVLGRGATLQSPVTPTSTNTPTIIRPSAEPSSFPSYAAAAKPMTNISTVQKNLPSPVSEDEALARRLQEQEEAEYQQRIRENAARQEQQEQQARQQQQQSRQNIPQPPHQQQPHRRVMYGSGGGGGSSASGAPRGVSAAMVNHHPSEGSSHHRGSGGGGHHQVAPQPPPLPRHSSGGGGSFGGSHQQSSRSGGGGGGGHHQQHRRSAGDGGGGAGGGHERPSGRSLSEDDGDSRGSRGSNKCSIQ
ncbi:Ubiquitin carboxyl-terminal hydrolase MINDY-2 [Tyrophagus putrescentiae]|nr:Ubiquitin carboxyl-terminal hydrolase MINDY-2 [Tyrophagus putrescentiae]